MCERTAACFLKYTLGAVCVKGVQTALGRACARPVSDSDESATFSSESVFLFSGANKLMVSRVRPEGSQVERREL